MDKYVSILNVLLAVFLGGYLLQIILKRRDEKRKSLNVAAAYLGELESLLAIYATDYTINFLTKLMEESKSPDWKPNYNIPFRKEDMMIFTSWVDELGILEYPIPKRLVEFYYRSLAVLNSLESIKVTDYSPEERAYLFKRNLEFFNNAIEIGKDTISIIKNKYRLN